MASIRVETTSPAIEAGLTATFRAFLLDSRGRELEGRPAPVWSSSNPAVAAVDPSAPGGQANPIVIRGVAPGTATITASTAGKSGAAQLTVNEGGGGQLTGRVFDAETPNQQGIPNATVTFVGSTGFRSSATTGADGTYTSLRLPSAVTSGVTVIADAAGYVSALTTVGDVFSGQIRTVDPIPLVRESTSQGGVSGTVRNARDNAGIAGAQVRLFREVGGFVRDQIGQTTSDAGGGFSFTQVSAGTYTLQAIADGFDTGERTAVAVGNNAVTPGQDVTLGPRGTEQITIVLDWGSSPADLDAHLTGPDPGGGRFHVFFSDGGSLTAAPFAALDVDDVSSFGPETITITQLTSGNYRFSVHDFTNRTSASSTALANSGAEVRVFTIDGLRDVFRVPPGQAGNLWTVFELTGDEITLPDITERNTLSFVEDPDAVLSRSPGLAARTATDADLIGRAVRALSKALDR